MMMFTMHRIVSVISATGATALLGSRPCESVHSLLFIPRRNDAVLHQANCLEHVQMLSSLQLAMIRSKMLPKLIS